MQKIYIEDLPIPQIEKNSYTTLVELASEILKKRASGEDTHSLEELVDIIVYELFDLNDEEIQYIESRRIGSN